MESPIKINFDKDNEVDADDIKLDFDKDSPIKVVKSDNSKSEFEEIVRNNTIELVIANKGNNAQYNTEDWKKFNDEFSKEIAKPEGSPEEIDQKTNAKVEEDKKEAQNINNLKNQDENAINQAVRSIQQKTMQQNERDIDSSHQEEMNRINNAQYRESHDNIFAVGQRDYNESVLRAKQRFRSKGVDDSSLKLSETGISEDAIRGQGEIDKGDLEDQIKDWNKDVAHDNKIKKRMSEVSSDVKKAVENGHLSSKDINEFVKNRKNILELISLYHKEKMLDEKKGMLAGVEKFFSRKTNFDLLDKGNGFVSESYRKIRIAMSKMPNVNMSKAQLDEAYEGLKKDAGKNGVSLDDYIKKETALVDKCMNKIRKNEDNTMYAAKIVEDTYSDKFTKFVKSVQNHRTLGRDVDVSKDQSKKIVINNAEPTPKKSQPVPNKEQPPSGKEKVKQDAKKIWQDRLKNPSQPEAHPRPRPKSNSVSL